MGTNVSKEMILDHAREVKGQMKTLPVLSWVADNPWKSAAILIGSKIFIWDWLLFRIRNRGLPPGPLGLPILGSISCISEAMGKGYVDLGKKYGEVIYLRMPNRDLVVLNGHDAIKQAFVKQGPDFSDRPMDLLLDAMDFEDEIFTHEYGEKFIHQKKFASNALRSFGFGTKALEERIQTEANNICDVLKENGTKPIDPQKLLSLGTANIICSILFSKSWSHDDPEGQSLIKKAEDFNQIFIDAFMLVFVPRSLSFLVQGSMLKTTKESSMKLRGFAHEMVREHKATFDPNHIRDVTDVYIQDRGTNSSERRIGDTMSAFMPDAIHTTTMIMRWIILCISVHQDVQAKIHKEIDEKVGSSRSPSESDGLDYTQATIREVMRYCNVMDILMLHTPRQETQLLGYRIPKGVEVIGNIYGVHFNEEHYPEADQFKPEHFLDQDGKVIKNDKFLTFGVGPRMCMGEKLSKQEILLVIASLLQKFSFSFPEDKPAPKLQAVVGFAGPEDYEIIATPR